MNERRLSSPWLILLALGLIPLYYLAPQQFMLLFWAVVQVTAAVLLWLAIIGQINHDRIPLHFGNLEAAILLAALVIAVRLGF